VRPERTAWLMLAPALGVIGVVVLLPLAQAAYLSVTDSQPDFLGSWIGLENYRRLLADASFFEALQTTLVFTVSSAGLSFVLGLAAALSLKDEFRGRWIVLVVFTLPWVFPTVVSATIFRMMLNEEFGILHYLAEGVGLVNGSILIDRMETLIASILIDVWRTVPFVTLLLLGSLRSIPQELHDAAKMDGASRWQRLWSITLPLLRPTIAVVCLFRVLDAARVFDLFWVMSQQLDSISTFVYTAVARSDLNFALGNAAAVLVFFGTAVICALFMWAGGLHEESALRFAGLPGGPESPRGRRWVGRYLLLVPVLIVVLGPVAWTLRTSMITPAELTSSPTALIPREPTLLWYEGVRNDPDFLRGLVNSAAVAGVTTATCLFVGSLAAYAIARARSRTTRKALPLILAVAFFPPVAVLAPLFFGLTQIGLIDTYWALILPDAAFVLPISTWLLIGFFSALPQDLEDAARVDGASTGQLLWRVLAPLAAPGLAATAAIAFVLVANEYLFARTFTFDSYSQPVTVWLADTVSQVSFAGFGFTAAASVVIIVILAAVVAPFLRRVTGGSSATDG
jgi:trehalose/maltose transport system permease protein